MGTNTCKFLENLSYAENLGFYGAFKLSDCISVDLLDNISNEGELCTIENNTSFQIKYFNKGDILAKVDFIGKRTTSFDLIAPRNGFYSRINKTTGIDEILSFYYETAECVRRCQGLDRKSIECDIVKDIYSHQLTLAWNSFHRTLESTFNFNIQQGIPVLEIISEKPLVKKGDKISMYFGQQSNITNIDSRSFSYEFKDSHILQYYAKDIFSTRSNTCLKHYKATLHIQEPDIFYFTNWALFSIRIEHTNGNITEFYNSSSVITNIAENIYLFKLRASIFAKALSTYNIKFTNIKQPFPKSDSPDKVVHEDICYVYLMVDKTNGYHKIGISNKPEYRERTLQSEKPTIELLCAKQYPTRTLAEAIESALHKVYSEKRIRGEWFALDSQDIEQLKTMFNN